MGARTADTEQPQPGAAEGQAAAGDWGAPAGQVLGGNPWMFTPEAATASQQPPASRADEYHQGHQNGNNSAASVADAGAPTGGEADFSHEVDSLIEMGLVSDRQTARDL